MSSVKHGWNQTVGVFGRINFFKLYFQKGCTKEPGLSGPACPCKVKTCFQQTGLASLSQIPTARA